MFCPQCGQQQVTGDVRFCSRCGFPLNIVAELLANGGTLAPREEASRAGKLTPRQKGIRQGAMLMLSAMLLVPLVAMISVFLRIGPFLIPLTAIACFMGGLMRIFYALLLEESTIESKPEALPSYVPPVMPAQIGRAREATLPPPQSTPAPSFIPRRYDTGELAPPSVTENTTRLLDDQPGPDKS